MKIVITNGRLVNPSTNIDTLADIFIADGKFIAICKKNRDGTTDKMPGGFAADKKIDASGKLVFPGIVDLSVRLREPGFEYKATIASETAAAASAGVTTVCCPPDSVPIVDNPTVVEMIYHRASLANKARVVSVGALTQKLEGEKISEMMALKNAGVVGVGNALKPVENTLVMRRAMEYAASCDMTVFIFSEDHWLRADGCANESAVSTRMGLTGIPEIAETIAVARDLALIEHTGVKAHFCRLSSVKAERMIARAQFDGLPVTADVSAHQLHLTDMDIGEFDARYHVHPPLRSMRDRDGLRKGLKLRTVNAICSDHQPHDMDAKIGPFSTTESGISAVETLLPLTMRLVESGDLSLMEAIACITFEPARILGLPVGRIEQDCIADVCIYDPEEIWQLNDNTMLSAGLNTPFKGWEFEGRVTHTILNGQLVFER